MWQSLLTHWGIVTHICVSKLIIIGSDNGLSPDRRQAIIWTDDGILLIEPLGTNFSEIITKNHTLSFKKMYLKMSFGKWRPSCLGLDVLNKPGDEKHMCTVVYLCCRRTLVLIYDTMTGKNPMNMATVLITNIGWSETSPYRMFSYWNKTA